MIPAVVAGLILLIAGGGGALWYLGRESGSSPAASSSRFGAKDATVTTYRPVSTLDAASVPAVSPPPLPPAPPAEAPAREPTPELRAPAPMPPPQTARVAPPAAVAAPRRETVTPPLPAQNPAIKTLLGKARDCQRDKRYDCAISNAEAVLTLAPKDREAESILDQAKAGQEEALSNIGIE